MFSSLKHKCRWFHRFRVKVGSQAANSGQAMTEYAIILGVSLPVGMILSLMFAGFDTIEESFYRYYTSLADYINLTFF